MQHGSADRKCTCWYVCRERGMQLAQLLQSRDTDAALGLLAADPLLAWVRDDESGGYPLHIAVWHVSREKREKREICHLFACSTKIRPKVHCLPSSHS